MLILHSFIIRLSNREGVINMAPNSWKETFSLPPLCVIGPDISIGGFQRSTCTGLLSAVAWTDGFMDGWIRDGGY